MAMKIHYSIFIAIITIWLSSLSFSFMAHAQTSGTATYYTIYTPSACYGYEDEGVMIGSASEEIWNNGAACGEMYQVNCVGGTNEGTPSPCWGSGSSVVVKIVDHCVNCRGTIDLSLEAFASIADTNAGVINISYQKV